MRVVLQVTETRRLLHSLADDSLFFSQAGRRGLSGAMMRRFPIARAIRMAGSLVFAKLKNFPYWPARVESKVEGTYYVYFFGTHETTALNISNLRPFNDETKKKYGHVKRKFFAEAMETIQNNPNYKADCVFNIPAATTKKTPTPKSHSQRKRKPPETLPPPPPKAPRDPPKRRSPPPEGGDTASKRKRKEAKSRDRDDQSDKSDSSDKLDRHRDRDSRGPGNCTGGGGLKALKIELKHEAKEVPLEAQDESTDPRKLAAERAMPVVYEYLNSERSPAEMGRLPLIKRRPLMSVVVRVPCVMGEDPLSAPLELRLLGNVLQPKALLRQLGRTAPEMIGEMRGRYVKVFVERDAAEHLIASWLLDLFGYQYCMKCSNTLWLRMLWGDLSGRVRCRISKELVDGAVVLGENWCEHFVKICGIDDFDRTMPLVVVRRLSQDVVDQLSKGEPPRDLAPLSAEPSGVLPLLKPLGGEREKEAKSGGRGDKYECSESRELESFS
ncbi:hepatoma-derived growth factor isoform 2-like, partial [Tropilaelaps mercedesae]